MICHLVTSQRIWRSNLGILLGVSFIMVQSKLTEGFRIICVFEYSWIFVDCWKGGKSNGFLVEIRLCNVSIWKLKLFYFLCGCLGHGDSFCPICLNQRAMELACGWDISLKAQSRKANTATSVLHRQGWDAGFPSANYRKQINEQNLWVDNRQESWKDINPLLGFNLEGFQTNTIREWWDLQVG